jgi:hypothetical protein
LGGPIQFYSQKSEVDSSLPPPLAEILSYLPASLFNEITSNEAVGPLPNQVMSSIPISPPRLHPLHTSHPRFMENIMRCAEGIADLFGIRELHDLRHRFPLEKFFDTVRMDWEQFRANGEVFDGSAVEFQIMSTFDRLQRKYLNDMFRNHPVLRQFRLASSHFDVMPPSTPQRIRPQIVLEQFTDLTNMKTVPLSASTHSDISVISDVENSISTPSFPLPFDSLHPTFKENVREHIFGLITPYIWNKDFDFGKFHQHIDTVIFCCDHHLSNSQTNYWINSILKLYVDKCSPPKSGTSKSRDVSPDSSVV